MLKKLLLLIGLLLLLLGGYWMKNRGANAPLPAVLGEQTQASPSPGVSPVVLGKTEDEVVTGFLSRLIACIGPDGNTAQASQTDCDNLWQFWNSHPPAGYGGDGGSSGSSGSSGGSSSPSPSPESSPEPLADPEIDDAWVYQCDSESCWNITTVEVEGSNFDDNARLEVVGQGDGLGYNEDTSYVADPDAVLTGSDGSSYLLTDFYNLPCQMYDVRVYFISDAREAGVTDVFVPGYCEEFER